MPRRVRDPEGARNRRKATVIIWRNPWCHQTDEVPYFSISMIKTLFKGHIIESLNFFLPCSLNKIDALVIYATMICVLHSQNQYKDYAVLFTAIWNILSLQSFYWKLIGKLYSSYSAKHLKDSYSKYLKTSN